MERKHEQAAQTFRKAIETITSKPDNLDNLESYLSMHFAEWLKKWANTPEGLAVELREFANMII